MNIKILSLTFLILAVAACSSDSESTDVVAVVNNQQFSEPIGAAERGEATFEISCEAAFITALDESETESESGNLIEAQVGPERDVTWRASDGARTEVFLIQNGGGCPDDPHWDIQLSPSLPMSVNFDAANGSLDADMRGLDLRTFDLELNSGFADLTLPANEALTNVTVDNNNGVVDLNMEENANVRLDRIYVNQGNLDIAVAKDSEVRIELLEVNGGEVRIEVPEPALLKATTFDVNSGTLLLDSAVNIDLEATLRVNSGDFFLNVPHGTSVQIIVPARSGARIEVPINYNDTETSDGNRVYTSPEFPSEFSVILHFEQGSGRVFVNRDE